MKQLIESTDRMAYCQSVTVYTERGGQITYNGREAFNHLSRHGQIKLDYYKKKFGHLVKENDQRLAKRNSQRSKLIDLITKIDNWEDFCTVVKKFTELSK